MPLLDGISVWGLGAALALPWLAGAALVGALLPNSRWSIVLGHGYLAGQIVVIVSLRVLDALGWDLTFVPVAIVLVALTLASGGAWWWFRMPSHRFARPRANALWHLLWLVPLVWFVFERWGVMLQEQALRPLYGWDAWMNWVPKAVVWFHHTSLTPFVSPADWLQAGPGAEVYTLGNARASEYPAGVPLLLLWVMLGAGSADHTLLYLPWLLLPLALALALWGHLRAHAAAPWLAALAVYAWLSQPLPNTHAVLAGYADPWLAVAFCLGALALDEWQRAGGLRHAALALVMALACSLFKVPGLPLAGLLLVAAALVAWRPPARLLGWLLVTVASLLTIGLLLGMWPGFWEAGEALVALEMPGVLPSLRIQLTPFLPHLAQTMFVYGNWHLLWVLVVVALCFGLAVRGRDALLETAPLVFIAALGFLVFVFGFTHYFLQVERGVTFHRAMTYLAPLAVFVSFRQIVALWNDKTAVQEAER